MCSLPGSVKLAVVRDWWLGSALCSLGGRRKRRSAHLRRIDNSSVLLAFGGYLGLLGYVLGGLDRMTGDMDGPQIAFSVFAAVDQRRDVIEGDLLSIAETTAAQVTGRMLVHQPVANALRCALIVGLAYPFLDGTGHYAALANENGSRDDSTHM